MRNIFIKYRLKVYTIWYFYKSFYRSNNTILSKVFIYTNIYDAKYNYCII
ncbi:Hypothetical protein FNO222_1110 [Francisella orientalis]|uniref:Uncharacterized protein n=1 Tax=Francisella orientalis TaxID=299583 RepID=A0ABM5U6Y5_9GAMM|nr:hypothetical protein FNO12_1101 [Francisella orientalis FNO12]AKN87266.1 Hypothetical protein FNO24_1103 [Francisella orientalis FNO24]AKN88803.1 Hypothetical protein FNO190_1101 [Francisella orientalis]AKU05561.1 Hypothetical protein FNO01_1101 [Francisella orientalis]QEN20474.1 Hypothetical protein FNO39_1110 [Francisella orientalis]